MPGLGVAQAIVAGLSMIGILVLIHEAGHYLAAKMFGIAAPVFSIGVGPRIWGFHWRGTDWRLSALPFGGYVRLAGADPFGEEDPDDMVEPGADFMSKPVWQRLVVMAAGPTANLMLPIVLFAGVKMLGEPQPDNLVGRVEPGRQAEAAGFRVGDEVVAVAGEPVETWIEFLLALGDHAGKGATVAVERDGARVDLTFPPDALRLGEEGFVDLDPLGISHSPLSSRIGVDDPTSPAWRAGLRTGDAVVGVDGTPIRTWHELQRELADPGPDTLTVKRAVDGKVTELPPVTLASDPQWTPRAGDPATDPWGLVPALLFVGDVAPDGAAQAAGVRGDDRLWSVDGQIVRTWSDLVGLVGATVEQRTADATPRPLDLVVVRDGQQVALTFTPKVQREVVMADVRYRPVMGIRQYPDVFVQGEEVKKYYSIVEAVPNAVTESWLLLKATVQVFANLATGELKPQESLGGPVEIFRVAGAGAKAGAYAFARLMGSISFSLGFMNFLPIPVLDGGHILFYLIEGIRGRPLSIELRERVQAVGVLALVGVMLLVTVMDVGRWIGGTTP